MGASRKKDSAVGRPKDAQKRQAILDAARAQFLSHGFERAGMDAIAADAGVSKLTVYSHFGSKEALFKHVIEAECSRLCLSDDCEELRSLSPKEGLTRIARRFVALVFRPESINMHRIMLNEVAQQPKVGQLFYEAGPQPLKQGFSLYLKYLTEQGKLQVDEPERATHYFFCLLKGDPHFRALLNLEPLPTPQALEGHITDVVAIFLRAYRPD